MYVADASTWDWGNRQKVRAIGPWHIHSFERLLAVVAQKVESGCEEIDLTEAPFYAGRWPLTQPSPLQGKGNRASFQNVPFGGLSGRRSFRLVLVCTSYEGRSRGL